MQAPRDVVPGVTVVIPVKDRADLLAETLRSLSAQTRPADEVIVVDDASRDDSAAVAEGAGAIVIRNTRSLGPSAARNLGIERATRAYLCPLDSDDILLPEMLERLARALDDAPGASFAFGRALVVSRTEGGWQPEGVVAPPQSEGPRASIGSLFAWNYVPSCAVMARTEALREVGGYPTDYVRSEDHYLWLQLARRGEPVAVDEVVGVHRRHAGNRHDPVRARDATEMITRLAETDPELAGSVPERRGMQYADMAISTLYLRRPLLTLRVTWDLVLRPPRRLRTLRAAVQRWRERRLAGRRARELWRESDVPQLLASYQ